MKTNISKTVKRILSLCLAAAVLIGTCFTANIGIDVTIQTEAATTSAADSVWSGEAATSFAGGTGTEADPYIIETAEQLFLMVKNGGMANGAPAYYKVQDGVTSLNLSSATSGGYSAVKALASGTAGTAYHNWNTDSWTVFSGNFDGNGVTIRGMISKSTVNNKYVGLIHVIGEDAIVKNVNFDTCYAYNSHANNSAILASQVIFFNNEDADSAQTADDGGKKDGYSLIYNVSVRNSSIKSTSNSSCAGLVVSFNGYPDMLQFVNCLYDGYSCELGNGTTGTNANGGIAAFSWGINNAQFSGCVSLGAPIASDRINTDKNYNDYRTDIDGVQHTYSSGTMTYVCHPVYVINCYTDIKENVNTTAIELVDSSGASLVKDATADKTITDNMPLLDWANGWYVATDVDGRKLPMPLVRAAEDVPATWDSGEVVLGFNALVGTADGGAGGKPYNGRYGNFDRFVGSGTEADPYIISTPLELARAIGAGGTHLNNRLYFKLANDIDVSGMPWINTVAHQLRNGSFAYVPFVGVLDGDGHTVTGLYAVNNDGAAGLIPVLESTGVVKNLHIRDSYVASSTQYSPYKEVTDEYGTATEIDADNPVDNTNTAGAIAGLTTTGAQIIGCSVENTAVFNSENQITADGNATTVNSYINDIYFNADGDKVSADQITVDYGTDATDPVWYKGGTESSKPQLVNRAHSMTEVDVAGNGDNAYDVLDLVALRNKLLRKSSYQNIYGDVSKNGVVNLNDLVILRRAMVDDYRELKDGFWRNVECGQIAIYYSENDTQDMARKLEIYFENEIPGLDMQKYATSSTTVTDSSLTANDFKAAPSENAVIITQGDPASVAYNEYSVSFDSAKNLVNIYGGSFTAVEQAVLYFIAGSDRATNKVYTVADGDILSEKLTDIKITNAENSTEVLVATETESEEYSYKQSVTIGGKTYYYAWGDEFDGENSTISANNWQINSYRTETENSSTGAVTPSQYTNQENPNLDDLDDLWVCADGRLQIWRGVNTDAYKALGLTEGYEWGYKELSLGTSGKNDWGKNLDENDVYIDPGLITTKNSVLFKQGYIEMEAALPSDGHAFPAWWFLTYTGEKNNNNITNSLYGKVFKENSTWNQAEKIDGSDPDTYKYQLPSAHLEFDIVEPMQNEYGGTSTTAFKNPAGTFNIYRLNADTYNHYKRDFNLTVHKIYDENAIGDNLYIIDWSKTGVNRLVATYQDADSTADNYFKTTSTAGTTFIHNYDTSKYGGYKAAGTTYNGAYNMGRKMTGTVKYGFSWNVDVAQGNYGINVYIDTDGDGDMSDETAVMTLNQDNASHKYSDYILNLGKSADAEVWNQYAYMLIDNCFYTASGSGYNPYTDLLSQEITGGGTYTGVDNYKVKDKATFEINYVRVYQEDGKRDIVTPETEAFNNGNHFGY